MNNQNTSYSEKNSRNIEDDKAHLQGWIEGVAGSIFATIIISLCTLLGSMFLDEYRIILPDVKSVIICIFAMLFALIGFNYLICRYGEKPTKILNYILSLCLLCMLFIAILRLIMIFLSVNESTVDINTDIIPKIKNEALLLFIILDTIILYAFVRNKKRYYEEIENHNRIETLLNARMQKIESDFTAEIGNYSEQITNLLKKMDFDTAVTGTTIPFLYDSSNNTIKTYLIANTSYPGYKWMFPGGHVLFGEGHIPEVIAESRAKEEANIEVDTIDLYHSFKINADDDNQISNMTIYNAPHFLYLFKLDESAKCFNNKGHQYHFDAVYVSSVSKEEKAVVGQKRVTVVLESKYNTLDEINAACHKAVHVFYKKNKIPNSRQENVPDYVEKMLFDAFIAYKSYMKI